MYESPLVQDIMARNVALGIKLGVGKHIDVKQYSWPEPVTVQVLDDDIVDTCNHAGAYDVEVDALEWDGDSHSMIPTGSTTVLMCDKDNCNAQYNPWDSEWVTP